MKKFLKIAGTVLVCIVLFIAVFAAYVNFKSLPVYEVPAISLQVDITPQRVANGQRIASMLCIQCHANDKNQLTGKWMKDAPAEFGKICSKNITQHPESGIGRWTDAEIYVMLRTGIKPDGSCGLFMPKFPLMAEEDIKDIIAWLRSGSYGVQPVEAESEPSQPSLLGKFLANFIFKPTPMPMIPVALPDTNNLVALGEYVVNRQIACYACHSKDFKTINELDPVKSEGYCGGGNPMLNMEGETVVSSNITFDKTGIGNYTIDEFVQAVKYGKKRDGTQLRYPMIPHTQLTDTEVKGVYAYLKTIPQLRAN